MICGSFLVDHVGLVVISESCDDSGDREGAGMRSGFVEMGWIGREIGDIVTHSGKAYLG